MDVTVAGTGTTKPQGRDRILAELRSSTVPLHPALLAGRLGLHLSTVRRHLQGLEASGLVEPVAEHREDPGRPRVLYRATTSPGEGMPVCVGYRFVAESLARWLETSVGDARETAMELGSAWGQHLVNAPPLSHTGRDEAIRRLFDLLDGLGYQPSRVVDDGTAIELGRCPFEQLTRAHPSVGCGLHLGLVRGALTSLGAEVEMAGFDVAPSDPGTPCVVSLRPVPAATNPQDA